MMIHAHSIAFAPLKPEELHDMRQEGRAERSFDARLRDAGRLTFLAAAGWGRLDPEAALGLKSREVAAILALASTPARTAAERDHKIRIVRAWRDGGDVDPILGAMVTAAIEVEAAQEKAGRRTPPMGGERS